MDSLGHASLDQPKSPPSTSPDARAAVTPSCSLELRSKCTTLLLQKLTAPGGDSKFASVVGQETSGITAIASDIESEIFVQTMGDPTQYREQVRQCAMTLQQSQLRASLCSRSLPPQHFVASVKADDVPGLLEALQERTEAELTVKFGTWELPPPAANNLCCYMTPNEVALFARTSRSARDIASASLTWKTMSARDFMGGAVVTSLLQLPTFASALVLQDGAPTNTLEQCDTSEAPPSKRMRVETPPDSYPIASHALVLDDITKAVARWSSRGMTDFFRAHQEGWRACYKRHFMQALYMLNKELHPRIGCPSCGLMDAIVRYNQHSMQTIKYAACQTCGHVVVLERSTGDLPKMSWM
jgi:hypothetical protein